MLGVDVVEHGVAREALADVEAGVGAARRVGVVELAVDRVEGVDAVVAVAVGREVRAAVAVDAGPEEAVDGVVARGHVLDRDAVGAEHPDAVVELELAVEDHLVAVEAADRQLRVVTLTASWYTPGDTRMRSPGAAASTASWIVA